MSETFKNRVIDVWKERRPDIKSVRKLEQEIGLSNGLIASWSKSEPSKEKIEKVANFFHVSVDYLLDRPINNNPVNSKETKSSNADEILYDNDLITHEKVEELFRKFGEQEGLTENAQEELVMEMSHYLEYRLTALREINKR